MKKNRLVWIYLGLFLLFSSPLFGQGYFRGSNLLEYQLGNIPSLKPEYQSSLYDQLNLSYKYKSFTFQTRIEQYYPSFGDDINYIKISQYRANYKSKELSITIGNLYSMFGTGLLMRTYEIPGSIWEDRGYRVRYGFYKDLEGAEINYKLGKFKLKGVYGRILDVALPPTLDNDNRRSDLIQGAELSYQNKKLLLGAIFMNHKNATISDNYTSAYFKNSFSKSFSFYGEFAIKAGSDANLTFENDSAYSIYLSFNYIKNKIGVSLELKEYNNFSIGTGISDPPTLVKEHSYKLLNRSTHVPILTFERGYQIELYYQLPKNGLITINNSLAQNKLTSSDSPVFKEIFIEYKFNIGNKITNQVFIDYSSDPFINETNRYSGGFIFDMDHNKMNSVFETQLQFIEREVIETSTFNNMYFSYSLNTGNKLSSTLLLEMSNDPFLLNNNEKYIFYPGAALSYKPNNKNNIILFYGKRRGGPACNSGVCYDVLDFQGLEIRIMSNF